MTRNLMFFDSEPSHAVGIRMNTQLLDAGGARWPDKSKGIGANYVLR